MTALEADSKAVARDASLTISMYRRVNLTARTGASMTAIGHEVYLYGGQVRVKSIPGC